MSNTEFPFRSKTSLMSYECTQDNITSGMYDYHFPLNHLSTQFTCDVTPMKTASNIKPYLRPMHCIIIKV